MKQHTPFPRDYLLVVVGQIISLFGNAILRFALPLHLLRQTGSSSLFGAVNACSFLPMIFFSLAGGVLADRWNKRNIMVCLDFCTAFLILGFYVLLGKVPLVPLMAVCLMILYGIFGAYQPAVQASIPILVRPAQLMRANAGIHMVNTAANLLGPIIGGILFGLCGMIPILYISAICFFCSAVMECFIRIPHERASASQRWLATVRADLCESWRYLRWERPTVLSIAVILAIFNLVLSAVMIVGIPIMVVSVLNLSDTALGLTQGVLGLGGLVGGLATGALGQRLQLRHGANLLSVCALAAALMGIALLSVIPRIVGYLLVTTMGFFVMAASAMLVIRLSTAVQSQTPPHLIGKVMAFILALANCASPLGQALYGWFFDLCSATPWIVLFVSAALSLLTAQYAKRIFVRFQAEIPH